MIYNISNLVRSNCNEAAAIVEGHCGKIEFVELKTNETPKSKSNIDELPCVLLRDEELLAIFSVPVIAVKNTKGRDTMRFLCYREDYGTTDWVSSDACYGHSENDVFEFICNTYRVSVPFSDTLLLELKKKEIQKPLEDREVSEIMGWLREMFVDEELTFTGIEIHKGRKNAGLVHTFKDTRTDLNLTGLSVHYSKVNAVREMLSRWGFFCNVHFHKERDNKTGRISIRLNYDEGE